MTGPNPRGRAAAAPRRAAGTGGEPARRHFVTSGVNAAAGPYWVAYAGGGTGMGRTSAWRSRFGDAAGLAAMLCLLLAPALARAATTPITSILQFTSGTRIDFEQATGSN